MLVNCHKDYIKLINIASFGAMVKYTFGGLDSALAPGPVVVLCMQNIEKG